MKYHSPEQAQQERKPISWVPAMTLLKRQDLNNSYAIISYQLGKNKWLQTVPQRTRHRARRVFGVIKALLRAATTAARKIGMLYRYIKMCPILAAPLQLLDASNFVSKTSKSCQIVLFNLRNVHYSSLSPFFISEMHS